MKVKRMFQLAIFLSVLSMAVSEVAAYWVHEDVETQLLEFRLEMQAERNAQRIHEWEEMIAPYNTYLQSEQVGWGSY